MDDYTGFSRDSLYVSKGNGYGSLGDMRGTGYGNGDYCGASGNGDGQFMPCLRSNKPTEMRWR
jgi:hypothetical protein